MSLARQRQERDARVDSTCQSTSDPPSRSLVGCRTAMCRYQLKANSRTNMAAGYCEEATHFVVSESATGRILWATRSAR